MLFFFLDPVSMFVSDYIESDSKKILHKKVNFFQPSAYWPLKPQLC